MTDSQIDVAGFIDELGCNLNNSILPYWSSTMVDPRGGFYPRRDGHDTLHESEPKGAILNARILWSYSAAYAATGREEYREMALRARDYILAHFIDREHGGVYWSVNPDGTPCADRKQYYALAFTIYGLAEYAMATGGDAEALEAAMGLFDMIELHSYDPATGGYLEASARDWTPLADMRLSEKDANSSRTMNTHLHILEAYSALLRATGSERVREATVRLLRIFLDRIIDRRTWHLGLFFNDRWEREDGIISYGHDIEASWLLLEAALQVADPDLTAETRRVTRHVAEAALQGLCYDGSMVYERHASGSYDNEKHWWVQAESLVGQLYLYHEHGLTEYLPKAMHTWQYIKDRMVDPQGEWYWSRMPDGTINRRDDKAGFWKCPYHNSRACLEASRVLRESQR